MTYDRDLTTIKDPQCLVYHQVISFPLYCLLKNRTQTGLQGLGLVPTKEVRTYVLTSSVWVDGHLTGIINDLHVSLPIRPSSRFVFGDFDGKR